MWTELFRSKCSVYALNESGKVWTHHVTSGIVIMLQSISNPDNVRIKCESNNDLFIWRLTSSKLKPKEERTLVITAWSVQLNQQEVLAIHFNSQTSAVLFAKKYIEIYPLSVPANINFHNIFPKEVSHAKFNILMMLESLINGYLTMQNKLYFDFAPKDIIQVIIQFVTRNTFDIKSNLLVITTCDTHTKTFNLSTETLSNVATHNWSYQNVCCVINNESLPPILHTKLPSNYPTQTHNKWSMLIHMGCNVSDTCLYSDKCSLTAYNLTYGNLYGFKLPSLPNSIIHPSAVYCKTNHILYALNSQFVRSLDFKETKDWRWNTVSDGLKSPGLSSSVCMVRDTFIAIMSSPTNRFELFDINCKGSVWLKNMINAKENAKSIYHETFHQILLYDKRGLDLYDFNKNQWFGIMDSGSKYCKNHSLWISSYNPNIVYFASINLYDKPSVKGCDLRTYQRIDVDLDFGDIGLDAMFYMH